MFWVCDYKNGEYGVIDSEDLVITYASADTFRDYIRRTGAYIFGYDKQRDRFIFDKEAKELQKFDLYDIADKIKICLSCDDYELTDYDGNPQIKFTDNLSFIYLRGIGLVFHFSDGDEILWSTFSSDYIDFVRKISDFSKDWRYRLEEFAK